MPSGFGNNSLTKEVLRAVPQPLQSLAFGSVGASYVQAAFFDPSVNMIILYSSYNTSVLISMDGTNDFMEFPAGGTMILDFKSNLIVLPGQTYGIFVKELGAPPASGNFRVSSFIGD